MRVWPMLYFFFLHISFLFFPHFQLVLKVTHMILNRVPCSEAFCRFERRRGIDLETDEAVRGSAQLPQSAARRGTRAKIFASNDGNVCQRETQEGRKITQYILDTRD